MFRLSRRSWTLLGLALSAVLLTWAFWDVDLREVGAVMLSADPLLLLAVVVLCILSLGVRGWRWQQLVCAAEAVPAKTVILATLVGHLANNLLPARSGEVVRLLVLGRKAQLSKTTLLGTLVLDHAIEGAGLVLIMAVLPSLFATPGWLLTVTVSLASATLGLLVLGTAVLVLASTGGTQRLPIPAHWAARLDHGVRKFGAGFAALRKPYRLLSSFAIGMLSWLIQGGMVMLCLRATHLPLDFEHALFVLAAINVAVLIPGAPSGVGPFEVAAVMALAAFGVAKAAGLSFGLLYHFIQILPTLVVGFAAIPALGLTLKDLTSGAAAPTDLSNGRSGD